MKKWVFLKSWLNHRKNAYKVMVLVKMSYQEDPIAVIFIMVAWPEVAYEIDFHKKSSNLGKLVIVPVPDRSFLKSSGGLPELIWGKISRSRRWDTSRSPKSSQKIQKSKKSAIKLPIYRPSGCYVNQSHNWSRNGMGYTWTISQGDPMRRLVFTNLLVSVFL